MTIELTEAQFKELKDILSRHINILDKDIQEGGMYHTGEAITVAMLRNGKLLLNEIKKQEHGR